MVINKNGEIIIIEDDLGAREFLQDILRVWALPTKIFLEDPTHVISYLDAQCQTFYGALGY